MSQRLIIAIGISGFIGVVLLVVLNVVNAFQAAPTASPRVGAGPTPTPTLIAATMTPSPSSLGPTASGTGAYASPTAGGPTSSPSDLGEGQSPGSVTLTLAAPLGAQVKSDAVCEWAQDQPLRVQQVATVQDAAIEVNGEPIEVQVMPLDRGGRFLISRLATTSGPQHAPYGPTRKTPGTIATETGADGASGTLTFGGIGTTAGSVPPDLLPVKRAVFGQPFGNDAGAKQIRGTLAWQCQPSPTGYQPVPSQPSPSPLPSNDPSALHVPAMTMASTTGHRQTGFSSCRDEVTSPDGSQTTSDQCVTAWLSPDDYPATLTLRSGGRIVLAAEQGWRLRSWTVRASQIADVEATLGKPKRNVLLFQGDRAAAPVGAVFFKAPTSGTWILRATVATNGPDKATAQTTYFFIVKAT
jgi:hypothetical protein